MDEWRAQTELCNLPKERWHNTAMAYVDRFVCCQYFWYFQARDWIHFFLPMCLWLLLNMIAVSKSSKEEFNFRQPRTVCCVMIVAGVELLHVFWVVTGISRPSPELSWVWSAHSVCNAVVVTCYSSRFADDVGHRFTETKFPSRRYNQLFTCNSLVSKKSCQPADCAKLLRNKQWLLLHINSDL